MGGVNAVALSQDETTVITMGQEKRVTYWDLREHHPVLAKVRNRGSGTESCKRVDDDSIALSA